MKGKPRSTADDSQLDQFSENEDSIECEICGYTAETGQKFTEHDCEEENR